MEQWEVDQLNYKVKSIEETVGVTFKGSTINDKQEFVDRYWNERMKIIEFKLEEAFNEFHQHITK